VLCAAVFAVFVQMRTHFLKSHASWRVQIFPRAFVDVIAVKPADKIIINLIQAYLAGIFLKAMDGRHSFLKEKVSDGLRVFAAQKVIALFTV